MAVSKFYVFFRYFYVDRIEPCKCDFIVIRTYVQFNSQTLSDWLSGDIYSFKSCAGILFSLFQDSLNDTYGELKVPVPMTLIHHDGHRLTTRQILSMESLREVIRKHEKVC
jgi:hypothetical protein